jgi:DNA (cytosine-5)-methyltransferase 3A
MKVLSLFDGMSCGQIALDQLGIPVETYYASEIDKYAIQVTQQNYPNTIQVGDITKLDPADFMDVDLILAGSPCQGFSFAGKQLAFDDPRSALFFEFIRLLKAIKPKYFLLENVRMKQEFLDIISKHVSDCYPDVPFGIDPILINSSLLSAQSRLRYYWTNIPYVTQPEDRGVVLRDILDPKPSPEFYHGQKSIAYMERGNEKWQQAGKRRADRYEQTADKEKSFTITENWHKGVPYNYFKETKPKQVGMASDIKGHDILRRIYSPDGKSPTLNTMGGGNREPKVAQEDCTWRKLTPLECERLQTVPDNYTDCVSNTQRYKMLGNGWTVEVIKHILHNIVT